VYKKPLLAQNTGKGAVFVRMYEIMRRLVELDLSEKLTTAAQEWLSHEIDNGASDIAAEKIRTALADIQTSHIENAGEHSGEAAKLVDCLIKDFKSR